MKEQASGRRRCVDRLARNDQVDAERLVLGR
jgi:hypothetical protein